MIHVDTIMKSPSGLRFTVIKSQCASTYLIRLELTIKGEGPLPKAEIELGSGGVKRFEMLWLRERRGGRSRFRRGEEYCIESLEAQIWKELVLRCPHQLMLEGIMEC